MNPKNPILAVVLFILGFAGILSMLTSELPIPEEIKMVLAEQFSPSQIKLLLLVNPTILFSGTLVLGMLFYKKAHFQLPIIEKLIGKRNDDKKFDIASLIKTGLIGGLAAGVLITGLNLVFDQSLPAEFVELSEKVKPSLLSRFLYGGITEEIMMRFGLMSFIAFILSKITKGFSDAVYWISIGVSAILFALGHLPVAFQSVANPSLGLIAYIIIGNTVGGVIFGWLYWKKGLESAILGHMMAHVVMVSAAGVAA